MSKLRDLFTPYQGLPKEVYVLFLAKIINAMGSFVMPMLTIILTDAIGLSRQVAGMYISISGLLFIPASMIGGKLADTIGRKKVITSGYFLFALVCLGFIIFNSLWIYIPLFILYGLVYATVMGNQRAYVSDLSLGEERATALGAFQTIAGICAIASGIIAGLLYDISTSYAFAYGALLGIIAAIMLAGKKWKTKTDY